MNPKLKHLKALIRAKRQSSEPLSPEDQELGFKGWYASRKLPHFDVPGAEQYVSYRLDDSMPASRRREWEAILETKQDQQRLREVERYLDRGYGSCWLRNPLIAELVQQNWWHNDGVKYRLQAWVVMPNHVHVLLEMWGAPLGEILQDWKGYTSRQANRLLGRQGVFWAPDYFDRFIRDQEHLRRVVRYIEHNPVKAGLVARPEDWLWSSARYRGAPGEVVPVLTHPTAFRAPRPAS